MILPFLQIVLLMECICLPFMLEKHYTLFIIHMNYLWLLQHNDIYFMSCSHINITKFHKSGIQFLIMFLTLDIITYITTKIFLCILTEQWQGKTPWNYMRMRPWEEPRLKKKKSEIIHYSYYFPSTIYYNVC